MGLACLCVKKAQGPCVGTKPCGKVRLGVLPGFWFTCLKSNPAKCVHLDAVWDKCAVHRADLEYQVIHGFSKIAFAKLEISRFISFDLFGRRAFQRLKFCKKALTTPVSDDIPYVFILGGILLHAPQTSESEVPAGLFSGRE